MKTLGAWVLGLGVLGALYALLIFDASIASGIDGRRVMNLGLMQDRQNLLLASGIGCIVGVLLLLFGKSAPPPRTELGLSFAVPRASESEEEFKRAIESDNVVAMESLISGGVRAYGELPTGRGFLQYAIARRSKKAVALLLSKGASRTHKDSQGATAEHLARLSEDGDIKAIFSTPPAVGVATPSVAPDLTMAAQLERLAILRDSGVLSASEFQAAKSRVLGA